MSLMSISQLINHDYQVIFDSTSCHVQHQSGMVIGAGCHHIGVFVLDSVHLLSSGRLVH